MKKHTMDPGHVLYGKGDRAAMNSAATTEEKVRLGGQFQEEDAEWRARFYFQPGVAKKLRRATNKALGRRLGGS